MPGIFSLLAVVVAILIYFVLFREKGINADPDNRIIVQDGLSLVTKPDSPMGFGYKTAWIAVKSDNPIQVSKDLGLTDVEPANWETGLKAVYENYETHIFITPPLQGWVFAVGIGLPDTGDSKRPDRCTPVLKDLGKRYNPVCFFGTHRVVDFHAWARVDDGEISRAYAYLGERGETIWNLGDKTPEEAELNFHFFEDAPPEGESESYWDREDLRFPSEEDVINISELWVFNPLEIENMNFPPSTGYVGRIPRTWK